MAGASGDWNGSAYVKTLGHSVVLECWRGGEASSSSNCVIRAVVYIVLGKLLFRARHHLATTVALQVSPGQESDHHGWPIGIARDIILE